MDPVVARPFAEERPAPDGPKGGAARGKIRHAPPRQGLRRSRSRGANRIWAPPALPQIRSYGATRVGAPPFHAFGLAHGTQGHQPE